MKRFIYLILFFGISITSFAQSGTRWYILSLGDKPVGYYQESYTISNSGVATDIQIKLKIARLGSESVMESKQAFLESVNGRLTQIKSELMFSKQLNQITAEIGDNSIKVINSTGGKESTSEIPNTLRLLGNEGVRLLSIKKLSQPGDSITYNTFFPEYGLVVQAKRLYLEDENVEIKGKLIKARKVRDTFKGLPIIRISWLDNEGRFLKSTEPNPFGQMMLVLSDEKSAITISNSKTELSADQYAGTMARSNVRLPQDRKLESVTIKISHKNPELGFPKFEGAYQKVIEQGNNYVILHIKSPKIGAIKEPLTSEEQRQFIESSSFFNKDDTLVVKKAREIVNRETDPWKKAIAIRDWVNRNMKFDPGIALAPSSEVMRNLAGTCVSFATITATLCRAVGIPSRYLAGYVYVDGAWGGHAWVEVYIDESWIPIDGAMPSPSGVSDAARFFFSRTSGVNGISECFIGGSQLYATVDIEVLDYKLDGVIIKPKGALYTLTKGAYYNNGLGIKVKAVDGFSFTELDKFYPDNTIFSLINKSMDVTIKLKEYFIAPRNDFDVIVKSRFKELQIDSKPIITSFQRLKAVRGSNSDKAILIIENGVDVFVLTSEGRRAKENLDAVVKNMSIKQSSK